MSDRVNKLREDTFEAEVAKNEGLLRMWAAQIAATWSQVDIEELIHIGRIEMWRAWEKFDASYGCKFATFAMQAVKRRMTKELQIQASAIRVPRQANFTAWLNLRVPVVSMDATHTSSDGDEMAALRNNLADENAGDVSAEVEWQDEIDRLRELVGELPVKERTAIELTFFEGLSGSEAGRRMGRSKQRVHQLMNDGLAKLRRAYGRTITPAYNAKRKAAKQRRMAA